MGGVASCTLRAATIVGDSYCSHFDICTTTRRAMSNLKKLGYFLQKHSYFLNNNPFFYYH